MKAVDRFVEHPWTGRAVSTWRRLEEGPAPNRHGPPVIENLRLTSLAGLALVVLLALVYGTGMLFGDLHFAHFFTGFLIIPALILKIASTGWRFVHYYARNRQYRAAGPPWLLPRLLAIPLVLSTLVAVASGIILWAQGTQRGIWSTIHTNSVVILVLVLGVHLAIHLQRAVSAVQEERSNRDRLVRRAIVGLALVVGLGLAIVMAFVEPTWHGRSDHGQRDGAPIMRQDATFVESSAPGKLIYRSLFARGSTVHLHYG